MSHGAFLLMGHPVFFNNYKISHWNETPDYAVDYRYDQSIGTIEDILQ
jgi:hypothetical protein